MRSGPLAMEVQGTTSTVTTTSPAAGGTMIKGITNTGIICIIPRAAVMGDTKCR